jgi:hypothetical protein
MSKRRWLGLLFAASAIGFSASPGLSALEHGASTAPSIHVRLAKHKATTAPTSASTVGSATTQPAAWSPPDLAGDFAILSSRNIFLHGRPPVAKGPTSGPSFAKGSSGPSMILRGVARQGEQVLALVEDISAKRTRQVKIGDMVGDGKVVAITKDGFDSSIKGKISHVKVGQNIENNSAMASGKTGPTTQPVVVQEASPPSPAGPAIAEQANNPQLPVAAGAKLLPEKVINH